MFAAHRVQSGTLLLAIFVFYVVLPYTLIFDAFVLCLTCFVIATENTVLSAFVILYMIMLF